jgi:hypothetical protein
VRSRRISAVVAPRLALASTAAVLLLTIAAPAAAQRVAEPILNGIPPAGPASAVGWLLTARNTCSAVLVGCRTLLTAAHCLCRGFETGDECQPDSGRVLLASAGVFDVSAVIHPEFEFAEAGDLAVLRTTQPVEGVAPLQLHEAPRVPFGSPGRIAGFGVRHDGEGGLLRVGGIETGSCAGSDAAPGAHVCWHFTPPVGAAGEDSTSCFGDSGGPLVVAGPGGARVAGILSGTQSLDCTAPTTGWATDVAVHRDWIESTAGEPLGRRCSPLQVGDPGVGQVMVEESLAPAARRRHALHLPERFGRLLVSFNATGAMDFEVGGCARTDRFGGVCELSDVGPGQLAVELANRQREGVAYQLTVTGFGGATGPVLSGPCLADAETLCLQDGRFRVSLRWRDQHGGEGPGRAVPVDSADSGIFTFFTPDNWEVMVKVLDACVPTLGNHFWVFYAATTNQEFTLTVEDTETGARNTYFNPLGTVAETRLDTQAFATCP